MRKKPVLASKFLVKMCLAFYGRKFFKKKITLTENGMLKNLQPPYIVVANHSSFVDVAALIKMMYPNCANFVISETQKAQWPKLINHCGILPKKQFTLDMSLISGIKYCLQHNRPVVIYPEAKLSVVGKLNIIKHAVAKLVKMFKVPLVTVKFNGSYLHQPRWSKTKRFVPVTADVQLAVDADEAKTISVGEIHRRIVENLTYDDYAYQLENKIEIDIPNLVEGLEGILYKCSECGAEFKMTGHGNELTCTACGKVVRQNKFGQLEGGRFDKVTDWYAWETQCVREELQNGAYAFCENFTAQKLVGRKYVDLGNAQITHGENGIDVAFFGLNNRLDDGANVGEKPFVGSSDNRSTDEDASSAKNSKNSDEKSRAEGTANSVEALPPLHYDVGFFYTLSFNNDFVYLPTAEAVYRFKRTVDLGCTTKLNIAIEQQTMLQEK